MVGLIRGKRTAPTENVSNDFRNRRNVVWILGISLALKLILWLLILTSDRGNFLTADSFGYEKLAMGVLNSGTFASSTEIGNQPETFRTPGYPLFIAILYGMFLKSPSIVILAQILISTASVALVYRIAHSLWGYRTAFLAILLSALDMGLLAYSLLLVTETVFTFLLLCVLASLIPALKTPQQARFSFLTGLLLALATMVRPVGYYLLFPLLAALFVFGLRNQHGWRIFFAPACLLFPFLLIVGGWQTRNYLLTGSAAVSRIQGDLLFKKSAEVVALKDKITFEEAERRILDEQKKEAGPQNPELPQKTDSHWIKTRPAYLMKYPSYYFRRELKRAVRVFAPAGHRMFALFGFHLEYWPLGDLRKPNAQKYAERWLVNHPVWLIFTIFIVGHLFLLYFGGILAVWFGWKRRPVRAIHFFYAIVFIYFLLVSLAIGFQSRFLLPAVPILHLYTARILILLKKGNLSPVL